MRTSDFAYALPPDRIAQTPATPRDASRLMVCDRAAGSVSHHVFRDLPQFLRPGDALVVNETRVLPARLLGHKDKTGGNVEVLLLKRLNLTDWETLVKPGARIGEGAALVFGDGLLTATVLGRTDAGGRTVRFRHEGAFEPLLERLGQMPLPPYIREKLAEPERYQTVYAKRDGSAAAPTAGLHFTPELLARIRDMGVDVVPLLLHVGLGTFRPMKPGDTDDHVMHEEYYEVTQGSAQRINLARKNGGRIVAVGTTSVRTLETVADEQGIVHAGSGWTRIFIRPGCRFRAVDALITNFHLPESTLLMLVSAFWEREAVLDAYNAAVEAGYRFYSFGDAMMMI